MTIDIINDQKEVFVQHSMHIYSFLISCKNRKYRYEQNVL